VREELKEIDRLRIRSPEGIRRAADAFRTYIERIDSLVIGACHNIATMEPMRSHSGLLGDEVFGWTERERRMWIGNSKVVLDSPLISACRYEADIFWANASGFHSKTTTHYLDYIDLSNFERRTGVKSAIVAPVHLPMGNIGVVFYSPRDPKREDLSQVFETYNDLLSMCARIFVSSYARVQCGGKTLPSRLKLSAREVECLQWAAYGKTDAEIGIIMSRSPSTIRFHIQNVSQKLDTVNRGHTIYKAGQLGFIGRVN
jgi:LuxR family transcriptional regulator, quorum-sensing system regulator CciR